MIVHSHKILLTREIGIEMYRNFLYFFRLTNKSKIQKRI